MVISRTLPNALSKVICGPFFATIQTDCCSLVGRRTLTSGRYCSWSWQSVKPTLTIFFLQESCSRSDSPDFGDRWHTKEQTSKHKHIIKIVIIPHETGCGGYNVFVVYLYSDIRDGFIAWYLLYSAISVISVLFWPWLIDICGKMAWCLFCIDIYIYGRMVKLLKPSAGQRYLDLIISLEGAEDDDIACPPVRYYFGVWPLLTLGQL